MGEDNLDTRKYHEKPTARRSRPNLSNPRSTNDIVGASLRANPTQLRSATNRVPTIGAVCGNGLCVGIGGGSREFRRYF